ncbi:hypothetical protein [Kamptonema formosum]|uniref:hypothetical protein n=1 Tax=Kamptonema formosum TaxID=331992 RepID=UPI000346557E|nr:hypothetical protein [Oscillatoria sp. PCC 10802]
MQLNTVWQYGSSDPENTNNFYTIRQWLAGLSGKKITWRQRLIPATSDPSQIDWEPQRFDEEFAICNPELRGITLYWRKPDSPDERSTTPHKLELDTLRQQLYIHPQSQKELIIRVGLAEIVFQKISVKNPEWQCRRAGENCTLTLRDTAQQLEVKVTLSPANLDQLKQQLS